MDITREALKLFMMSLPSGSYFEIISFGSNYAFMKGQKTKTKLIKYNENSKNEALQLIEEFEADFGGTIISEPMLSSFNLNPETGYLKRIFLLTDGSVGNPEAVIELIKANCKLDGSTKVFTFGIGNGCSEYLVTKSAEAGKGYYCLVKDNEMG